MAGLGEVSGVAGIVLSVGLLSLGLALLVYCGDYLVSGAVKVAASLNVPSFVIGLTIVAFGTSAPELFVAVEAALFGQDDLVFGNVIGSNICNILLVLGLPALLYSLSSEIKGLALGTFLMLTSTALFVLFFYRGNDISHWEALGLLVLLAAFLAVSASQSGAEDDVEELAAEELPFGLESTTRNSLLVIVGATLGLMLGADLTVTNAVALSQRIPGVSPELVGLTIVAIGTSLPELACTMAAARRKAFGLGFGNIIGSNIFNIHAILGVAALFSLDGLKIMPAADGADHMIYGDIVIMFAATGLGAFYILGRDPSEPQIDRLSGLFLFVLYLCYVAYLVLNAIAAAAPAAA